MKIKRKIAIKKISTIDIAIVLVLLLYFEPAYISYNFSALNSIFTFLKNFIFMVLLVREVFYLAKGSKNRSSVFVYAVFFANLALLVSTYINGGETMSALSRLINTTATVCFAEICLRNRKIKFLQITTLILTLFITINLITMLLFPEGLYKYYFTDGTYNSEYWFLGQKNSIGKVCIITISIQMIINQIRGRMWGFRIYTLIVISFISIILAQSTTSLVVMILFTGALIFLSFMYNVHFERCSTLFRMRNYFIVAFAAFLFIAVFQAVAGNTFLANFVTNTLDKSITFTGRTVVWTTALLRFKEAPIFGYGIRNIRDMMILVNGTKHTSDCHNYYINILFQGGLLQAIPYAWLFYSLVNKLDEIRMKKIGLILSTTLFCFLIIFITECFYYVPLWILFLIMYHCDWLLQYEKEK